MSSTATPPDGFRVILSADRTQMAGCPTLLDGMVSASQTTTTPWVVLDRVLAPPVRCRGVRAVRAPLGLRRIEAALLSGGFTPDEVAVVPPEKIPRAAGANTRIIAFSTGDPLGLGMNTSTMVALAGGRPYTTALFQRHLGRARELRRALGNVKLVVGGPGAWQLASSERDRVRLGIDHVLTGYCEAEVAAVFRRILEGDPVDPVVRCAWPPGAEIPSIRGATTMGLVEISRGCGLGCAFCTLAKIGMKHISPERILEDVEVNLAAGVRDLSLISEDLFRYGGPSPGKTRPAKLLELLRTVRGRNDVRLIQTDHANVTSVAAFSDDELIETHRLLAGPLPDRHVWVNLGVETVSPRLLSLDFARDGEHVSFAAKLRPFTPDDWGETCRREIRRLAVAGFMPMVSLVTGLPGETDDDVERTTRWVRSLRGERAVIFPLLHAPLDPGTKGMSVADLTPARWRLFEESYRFNFRWLPRMLWREETHAGVGRTRRLVAALLARGNVLFWKTLFALKS
ncbi:MAG TPA: radical SAM protein [Planctomycetota bacterium]|nr:radical SAM protein [Planctomycetota bacterium]